MIMKNLKTYNPPLTPLPRGEFEKPNNKRLSKKFPSNGGVSCSDRVGCFFSFFTHHYFLITVFTG